MGKKMNRMQVLPLGSLNLKDKFAELLSPEYGSGKTQKRKKKKDMPFKNF